MKERICTQVHSHPELEDCEPIKRSCDPLVLPGYRVNSQCEDGVSEKCD